MADITAAMVKELRERTGQAMMDCKKALGETAGDMEQAVDLLRKKGMAVMDKRSEKETKEGRVVSRMSDDGKTAVLVSLCCETDFTAKNEEFQAVVDALADGLLKAEGCPQNAEELESVPTPSGKTVGTAINDIVSKTGEKTTIGPFQKFVLDGHGLLHSYVHFNGKIGTMIQIDAENDQAATSEQIKTLAADLAMHVTALNPDGVTEDDLDPDMVAREKEVAKSQVPPGKPDNIVEGIIKGKMNKWFQQIVLLHQPFVKDDSKSVQELVDEMSKAAGGKLSVKRFARVQIG